MLLVLSSRFDHSTAMVAEWLIQKNVVFRRWNGEDTCVSMSVEIKREGELAVDLVNSTSGNISLSDISKYWYRRGEFLIFKPVIKTRKSDVFNILRQEWIKMNGFLFSVLREKPHLGDITLEKDHNKLYSLLLATKSGLFVPHTLVTTEKQKIDKVYVLPSFKIITKAINNLFSFISRNRIYAVGTEVVELEHLNLLKSIFLPTLIQEKIDKAFELRIFFLGHIFFPMAIFSQLDDQTSVDFRNYNREKPNRCVPYLLPSEIELKLVKYIDLMGLDTGSIDLIVTKKGEFVFLEVNHIGQFGWLSENCNYYIEEVIAEHLSNL
jgi:ATP-GRASP peptide maturase of grasp-with-spasm system